MEQLTKIATTGFAVAVMGLGSAINIEDIFINQGTYIGSFLDLF